MKTGRRFHAEPSSVSEARRFVTDALGAEPDDVVDAVAVMVSEITTNAVTYAGGELEIALELLDGGGVRVELTDCDAGQPTLRQPESTDPRGRGLQIVDALADRWGVEPGPEPEAKTVWFEVRTHGARRDARSMRRREDRSLS